MRFAVLHHLESGDSDVQGDGARAASAIYGDVVQQVQLADALGFAIAWVAEHHFSAGKGRAASPLLFLIHLAAATRSIRLGSAVLPVPFYHPLRLAEDVAMTDVLTAGRFDCGLSSSGVPDEMRAFGAAQEGKHERLRESLAWLQRAWSGQGVNVPGQPEAPPVSIVPQPLQSLAQMVWIAASSKGAAGVAGEFGYHLLLPSLRPLAISAEHADLYRAMLRKSGHAVTDRHVQITQHLVLQEDHDAAMRTAEPIIRAYYDRYTRGGIVERLADESLPSIMARINFLAGGPAAVAEQLDRVRTTLGLTHVAFQSRLIGLTNGQVLRGLELLATDVAPLMGAELSPILQTQDPTAITIGNANPPAGRAATGL